MIMGEIKRFLRDDGMIKVSRTLRENGWKIKKAAEKISYEKGRNAKISEIAAATEITEEDIVLALDANSEIDSIYKSVYRDDGREVMLVDQIVAKETVTIKRKAIWKLYQSKERPLRQWSPSSTVSSAVWMPSAIGTEKRE